MKVDDKIAFGLFEERIDDYWYQMGKDAYIGEKSGIEIPNNAKHNELMSFRKGILDAARNMGDLEREDFYSESEYNAFNNEYNHKK